MNKIINALLAAKYPNVDVAALSEIVAATPNAEVATEILCGLYEMPIINEQPSEKMLSNRKDEFNITFLSYNKFNDEITYEYQSRKYKSVVVPKNATIDEYPDYNTSESASYNDSANAEKLGITVEEFRNNYKTVIVYGDLSSNKNTRNVSLSTWNGQ